MYRIPKQTVSVGRCHPVSPGPPGLRPSPQWPEQGCLSFPPFNAQRGAVFSEGSNTSASSKGKGESPGSSEDARPEFPSAGEVPVEPTEQKPRKKSSQFS